jgi:hypothetical protein
MRSRVFFIALGLAASAPIVWACLDPAPAPTPPSEQARWSEPARDALVPACGSCHRSDLPTAKPGALAVFDLTKDPWWVTIKEEEYEGLLKRVRGSSDIPEDGKAAVESFVAATRLLVPPTPEP